MEHAEGLLTVGDPGVRCGPCGSLFGSLVRDGAWAQVPPGGLEDASSARPGAPILVGSGTPWFTIADGLPQHAEFG